MLPGDQWDGKERRTSPHRYRRIHPWRWRMLTLWIILFSIACGWAIRSVDETSAKVEDLQKTNCNTKVFLLTAARRNEVVAQQEDISQQERDANTAAAKSYRRIADNFAAVGECLRAKQLQAKGGK